MLCRWLKIRRRQHLIAAEVLPTAAESIFNKHKPSTTFFTNKWFRLIFIKEIVFFKTVSRF